MTPKQLENITLNINDEYWKKEYYKLDLKEKIALWVDIFSLRMDWQLEVEKELHVVFTREWLYKLHKVEPNIGKLMIHIRTSLDKKYRTKKVNSTLNELQKIFG